MNASSTHHLYDVAIIGAGPAGAWLAAELGERGLRVAILCDRWPKTWHPTYSVWLDTLSCALKECVHTTFHDPCFITANASKVPLKRSYARLDNQALQALILKRTQKCDVSFIQGRVTHMAQEPFLSALTYTHHGSLHTIKAACVVDATGHSATFTKRVGRYNPGFQTAYGVTLPDVPKGVLGNSDMVLMDFSMPSIPEHTTPTFLYAMRLPDGHTFFEETALVGRPQVSFEVLKLLLSKRLSLRGFCFDDAQVVGVERCWIPMGLALPDFNQRTLAFGGAASMVHPATGYQMSRVFLWAPAFADSIASGVRSGRSPELVAKHAWQALWTPERVRRRMLYLYGMEVLLSCDMCQMNDFFSTFFALPTASWSGYVDGTLSHKNLAAVMMRIFGESTLSTRLKLVRPALGHSCAHLWRALFL